MDIEVPHPETARIADVDVFPNEGDEMPAQVLAAWTNVSKASLEVWHRRLGHLSHSTVQQMLSKGMVTGMEFTDKLLPTGPCEPCLKGKQTRTDISKVADERSEGVLGRIFSDLCEQPTRSHHGYRYLATFTDDKSRHVFATGLCKKSEALHHLKVFIAHAEVKTSKRTQTIQSDGGGEYDSKVVMAYLQERGISQELTTPDTPQHNGISEHMNRTLLNMARSMLEDTKLPESFWFEAVKYTTYIHNATPTCALEDTTPEEVWSGNKPDVSCLHVFGVWAFVHIPKKKRMKLLAHSMVCTFVGFAENRLAYQLYHRQSCQFLDS